MPKCRCRFLIPVADNNGKPFPAETFIKIKLALEKQFGAYKIHGPTEGSWQGQMELTHEIEIAVPARRVAEVRATVRAIGKELGQKSMYFDVSPPSVEIIDVESGEEEDAGDENE